MTPVNTLVVDDDEHIPGSIPIGRKKSKALKLDNEKFLYKSGIELCTYLSNYFIITAKQITPKPIIGLSRKNGFPILSLLLPSFVTSLRNDIKLVDKMVRISY